MLFSTRHWVEWSGDMGLSGIDGIDGRFMWGSVRTLRRQGRDMRFSIFQITLLRNRWRWRSRLCRDWIMDFSNLDAQARDVTDLSEIRAK